VDKLNRKEKEARVREVGKEISEIGTQKPILFSAKTGEGRKEIWERLLSLMTA
jgi:GTP-binding protein EngB required for normal cell division